MSIATISDSQAIALLCAPLRVGDARPLTSAEWTRIATSIHQSEVGHPGALMGMSVDDMSASLAVDLALAERLAHLFERGGPLAFELERLANRGIWLLTRADDEYPIRLRRRLGLKAPPVLCGSGSHELLSGRAVAIVGSRDASEAVMDAARRIAAQLGREQAAVVSGGARGIDRAAMNAVIGAGGSAVGFVADNLIRLAQQTETRRLLTEEHLALVTPFAPDSRFTVGNAMARNKLIYCAADAAIVASTTQGSGGTWAGAVEALRARWVPVWAWLDSAAPEANASLVASGARVLTERDLAHDSLFGVLTAADDRDPAASLEQEPGLPDLQSPKTRSFLLVPRSENELRDRFDIALVQVRSWMKACVESGDVIRRERPVRYVIREAEPSLFDSH